VTYFSATVSETASLPPRHWMACATCISGYACMHHHHAAGSVQEAHSVSTPNKKKTGEPLKPSRVNETRGAGAQGTGGEGWWGVGGGGGRRHWWRAHGLHTAAHGTKVYTVQRCTRYKGVHGTRRHMVQRCTRYRGVHGTRRHMARACTTYHDASRRITTHHDASRRITTHHDASRRITTHALQPPPTREVGSVH
jgi:hypothetical protein